MLVVHTALHGYTIEALDGRIGSVADFLFDDRSWQCRWLVIDTGTWLSGRTVLIHPSALLKIDHEHKTLSVNLTRQKVENSPEQMEHLPVSLQFEHSQYDYYGWDPFWGMGLYGSTLVGEFAGPPRYFGEPILPESDDVIRYRADADPNLRSMAEISSYGVHATDGDIGRVDTMLIDDGTLGIRYLIINTHTWWFGDKVLLSPFAITNISYADAKIAVNITRDTIKGSPVWDPAALIQQDVEERLHGYYRWPGYGWTDRPARDMAAEHSDQ